MTYRFACDGRECRKLPNNLTEHRSSTQDRSQWEPTYFPASELTMCRVVSSEGKGWFFADRVYCTACRWCRKSLITTNTDGAQCRIWHDDRDRRCVEQCPFIHSLDEAKQRPPGLASGEIAELRKPRNIEGIIQEMSERALDHSSTPRTIRLRVSKRWEPCHYVYYEYDEVNTSLSAQDDHCVSARRWSEDSSAVCIDVGQRRYRRGTSCESYPCVWCGKQMPTCTMSDLVLLTAESYVQCFDSIARATCDIAHPTSAYLLAGEWMCRTCVTAVEAVLHTYSFCITEAGEFQATAAKPTLSAATTSVATTVVATAATTVPASSPPASKPIAPSAAH